MAVQHHGIAHGLECPAPWVGVVIDVGNAFESQVQAADAKNLGGLIAVQQAEDVMRDDVVELAQFRRHCGIVRCNEFRVRQAEDAGVLASEFNLGIIGVNPQYFGARVSGGKRERVSPRSATQDQHARLVQRHAGQAVQMRCGPQVTRRTQEIDGVIGQSGRSRNVAASIG
ncbi:hypothetical protein G6F31_019237 [Rhizopus arrhizus]|nr:hypothetical protein G6F31_019237 [Rhizopus arrhizus]